MAYYLTTQELDSNGDIVITDGVISVLHDEDALSQILSNKIKLRKGEFSLELNEGTEWSKILGSSVDSEEIVKTRIRKILMGDPYVSNILALEVIFDKENSNLTGTFRVKSNFGTVTGSI
jgi:hypothetical protein